MEETTEHDDDVAGGTEDAVIAYLQAHKDFFLHHPELLGELDIPHSEGDGAISLIERQVSVLRERHKGEQQKLYALVQTARENERVAERLHRIAVEVAAFEDVDDALDTVTQLVKELFNVEYVSFRITSQIGDRPERVDPRSPEFADLYLRVSRGRSVCDNPMEPASKVFLFGENAEVGSAVLIPLGGSRPCGILALGSSRADRFSADQGTFYLDRLGELLGATIRRLADVR
jgi:uncharacterized protein YigA (DUF484 family)